MRVAILHDRIDDGAREDEADALVQADAIGQTLRRQGHRVERLAVDLDLCRATRELAGVKPDLVFNLVESINGLGRLIHLAPALLDTLHVPYTGSRTDAIYMTSHKLLAKRLLTDAGLLTPAWYPAIPGLPPPSPGRYIVKSVWEDASLGLDDGSVVHAATEDDLRREIDARADRLGGAAFAEAFVEGREFNLSLLAGPGGPRVLPPAEIQFVDYPPDKPRIVGYAAKWDAGSMEYNQTPRHFDFLPADEPLLTELSRLAVTCWNCFDLRGYARVDFRVDAGGHPWIIEANANPCLSPDAGFMAAAAQAGMSFDDVIAAIVADALDGP